MDWKLKKMIPTIAVSLVAFTSVLSAAGEEMQIRNLENRVSALEQKKGAGGVINPAVNPYCKDAVDLFLRADFLWMSAREDGLEYAYEVSSQDVAAEEVDVDAANVDREWKAGFRVGIGYYMSHDGWDLTLDWTRLHGKHDSSVTSEGDAETIVTPGVDFVQRRMGRFDSITTTDASTFTDAHAKWRADFDLVDLEMGRNFFVSKYLSLRPFVGLRLAILNQNMDYNYDDPTVTDLAWDSYRVHHKNDYSGLGLRFGLNGDWMFGKGWSLFGNAALSGLYGKFKVDTHEWEALTVEDSDDVVAEIGKFKDDYYSGKAALDLALGLRWTHLFSQDRYGLTIQLAWEDHVFFNQNQIPVWLSDSEFGGRTIEGHGDLSLQGLSLGIKFDF